MEKKINKWELKSHSYQIADTGDYDGHYELTNGVISLVTKDDLDDLHEEDSYISVIVEALNQLGATWEDPEKDNALYGYELEKRETKRLYEDVEKWKEVATQLYRITKIQTDQKDKLYSETVRTAIEIMEKYEQLNQSLPQ